MIPVSAVSSICSGSYVKGLQENMSMKPCLPERLLVLLFSAMVFSCFLQSTVESGTEISELGQFGSTTNQLKAGCFYVFTLALREPLKCFGSYCRVQ